MVDSATQDRLFSFGYPPTDIRLRRVGIDSSLPYSVALNKRHNCGLQSKEYVEKSSSNEKLHQGLKDAIDFQENICEKEKKKNNKLLAVYAYNINWPRCVCYLSQTDGSVIICEQERCRVILFTSQLMFRSTCGGTRGNGLYEFDSPWTVAEFIENSTSNILVADTNNRRIQCFTIGYRGKFIYKYTLTTKDKPLYLATTRHWLAVSCENGFLKTFFISEREEILNLNLNQLFSIKKGKSIAYCVCMDPNDHSIFVSNPLGTKSLIHQITIDGKYIRSIKLFNQPFLHIHSLNYDQQNRQFLVIDSINSVIYSIKPDIQENNVEILFKPADHLNHPQSLAITNEGHLIVTECSVLTQHAIKIFRYLSCSCHSRAATPSVKTSDITSVKSILLQY
ncbi:unnamed protein product [Adineta ricciae]|uniref:Uncharacterized protein n=1 Tax=Adineta ricciae TaxID=249248 RepID=A0A815A1J8_ADIRI|nr:unnamed protein product [Adineta ricciae]CAF1249887.1 unnamed protein product [Adineta ricciae]